ncbi:hypothetical protein [uncultured Lutibacter sp.]|jgi:hypothetical protein|uniref:hypothetical protein n=1 Tax=uncultured Lutibacter sp. TaxID=437739 RepID=UPI00261AC150|nr:hypothetical protein [uncultured Lutibacter sp.]
MKKIRIILMIVIAILTINSYSQNSNELRVYYGTSYAEFLQNQSLDGVGGYELTNFNQFGIKYLRQLSTDFYIETGISYSKSDLQITPSFTGEPIQSRYEKLEIVSVPIYANYTFWKYLFVNGGPILDFQTSDNSTDSQSGIGYGLGIGGKYNFDRFLIFVNPNFKRHSVIPFEKENHHQKLTELGVQFGIGFKF